MYKLAITAELGLIRDIWPGLVTAVELWVHFEAGLPQRLAVGLRERVRNNYPQGWEDWSGQACVESTGTEL